MSTASNVSTSQETALYQTEVETLEGQKLTLDAYRGKVLLIVNTASACGFTPQFAGLEQLYEQYQDQGFAVLGFPCNQFGRQEPGDAAAIGSFCQRNYGVKFPMHAKIEVNGPRTHPLFAQLKEAAPGVLGTRSIKWNFTKFLVDRQGHVVARFATKTKPEALKPHIERLL